MREYYPAEDNTDSEVSLARSYQFYIHRLVFRLPFGYRCHATFSNYWPTRELSVEPEMRNEGNRLSFSATVFFGIFPIERGNNEPRNSTKLLLAYSTQAERKCEKFTRDKSTTVTSRNGKSNKIKSCSL